MSTSSKDRGSSKLLSLALLLGVGLAQACTSDSTGGNNNGGNTSTGGNKAGNTAGKSGGSSGGSNAGSSGGSTGGNTGGNKGGSTGGSSGGNTGGNKGGSTGGSSGGSSGGNSGGSTGGSAGGNKGGSTGGSSGGSGGSGSGGSSGGSAGGELSCKDPIYGDVKIPAAAIISDFENNSLKPYATDGRAAGTVEGWRGWAGDAEANPETKGTFKIDTSVHGPCSSKGALHVASNGTNNAANSPAFGVDIMGRTSDNKKQSWDASKYTGVGFWAKCSGDVPFTFLKLVDGSQDADMPSATCSYSGGTKCVQHGVKNAVITKDWTYYKLYFDEVLQDPNGGTFTPKAFDKSKFVAFQVVVNPFSPRTGSATANKFDCYVDDVHFLSEAAPTIPSATVTWETSGNKIKRNGNDYKIRGLVRPSMEWDYAGFGITREDVQRMKSWNANTIRLAVKDTLWNGASTGSASGNGDAYKLHVKRAVSWILQQGMDVILDLHYVAGSPTDAHAAFWDTISKDSFYKDGRIIYELYNEPTADFNSLRTWMENTAKKIRANGAKNLILVGGIDYSFDISGYASNPITGQDPLAYVTHPYIFKNGEKSNPPDSKAYADPAGKIPVVATEFGDANVEGFNSIPPTQCVASIYSDYISRFEKLGMSWTSWAWIVDEWGCGFPQLIQDWSGTPNSIGKPVQDQLKALNK